MEDSDRNREVNESVIELLELSRLDSPFANHLLAQHRRRLVARLLEAKRIDEKTADYLFD